MHDLYLKMCQSRKSLFFFYICVCVCAEHTNERAIEFVHISYVHNCVF